MLQGVHDLLESVGALVQDGKELSGQGLQQFQSDCLVHVPKPVLPLCRPLDLIDGGGEARQGKIKEQFKVEKLLVFRQLDQIRIV